MKEAMELLNWVLIDMVYAAPETAPEKMEVWGQKLDKAIKLLEQNWP